MPRHLRLVKFPPSLDELRALASIFLSTPYTKYKGGIDAAHYDAVHLVLKLHKQKIHGIYSPILHWHDVAYYGGLSTEHHAWKAENEHKMRYASALLVGELDGWEDSAGIAGEIEYFTKWSKPVFYIQPETLELRK